MPLTNDRSIWTRALLISCLLAGWGCGKPDPVEQEDAPLEVVDVAPSVEISSEDDPQERRRAPNLSGVLPGDFPAELPLYLPSSVVDIDSGADGQQRVVLLADQGKAQVEARQLELVRGAGWTASSVASGRWRLTRGNSEATLGIQATELGTQIQIEYF